MTDATDPVGEASLRAEAASAPSQADAARDDPRRADIELLRVVAAFAIVWFHAQVAGHDWAYGGLVVFLILSTYLAEKSQPRPSILASRARRLLVPWIFWVIVYGVLNLCHGRSFIPLKNGLVAGLLAGSTIHLWYLPFVFFCLVAFDSTRRAVTPAFRAVACGLAAIVLLALSPVWMAPADSAGEPWGQYAQAFPAILIGSFLGARAALHKTLFLLIAAGVVAAEVSALQVPGVGLPYVVGTVLMLGVALVPACNLRLRWVDTFAPLTFGIYLVHPIFLHPLERVGALPPAGIPLAAFVLSALAIGLLRKLAPRLSRRIV